MLIVDLENPVDVELREPMLQSMARGRATAVIECRRGRSVVECLDHAPDVPVADHLASNPHELLVAEALERNGGPRTGGVAGVVGGARIGSTGVAGSAMTGDG